MQSRFSGAIAKWLGQSHVNSLKACDKIPFLNSFAFIEGETFPERFRVPVSVNLSSNSVSVSFPAFTPARHISSPAGTVSVKLMIAVAAANLSKDTSSGFQSQIIDIPFCKEEMPAKILDFSVLTVKGTIIVTAARLVFTGLKIIIRTLSISRNLKRQE